MIPRHILQNLVPLFAAFATMSHAADLTALKAKGAEITETKGEVSGLSFKKNEGLAEADYQLIKKIPRLKSLSLGLEFDDAALKALAGLPELESLAFNGVSLSDEGTRILASFPNLHNFAFFHPRKGFTGTGLGALAELAHLERLTVAGSVEFGDAGMAAVAKITHLKEFRTWHSGVTLEGIKKLQALKELKSLNLGQRLAFTPPVTTSDAAVAALAEIPSLEALSLSEARLTLPALSQLKALLKLKKLTLDGIEISESDVNSLKQQLPNTDIKWTAPSEAAVKRITGLFGAK